MRKRMAILAVAASALTVAATPGTQADGAAPTKDPVWIQSSLYDNEYHCVLAKNSIESGGSAVDPIDDDCWNNYPHNPLQYYFFYLVY